MSLHSFQLTPQIIGSISRPESFSLDDERLVYRLASGGDTVLIQDGAPTEEAERRFAVLSVKEALRQGQYVDPNLLYQYVMYESLKRHRGSES